MRRYKLILAGLLAVLVLGGCESNREITSESSSYETNISNETEYEEMTGVDIDITESLSNYEMESAPDYYTKVNTPLEGEYDFRDMIFEEANKCTYNNDGVRITLVSEGSSKGGTIVINGKLYALDCYAFRVAEETPQICTKDVNKDGVSDIFVKGVISAQSGYLVCQDVYMSQSDGTYRRLGDVVNGVEQKYPFEVRFLSGYKISVVMPKFNIGKIVKIHSTYVYNMKMDGICDENGVLTANGNDIRLSGLINQAVRYIEKEDGVYLRFEGQLDAGDGETGLGWCLVYTYKITNEGYDLKSVELERYDFN